MVVFRLSQCFMLSLYVFALDHDSYVPSSQGDEVVPEEGNRKQLRLYQDSAGDAELLHWTEVRRPGVDGESEATHFVW